MKLTSLGSQPAPAVYVARGLDTPCQNNFLTAVHNLLPLTGREAMRRIRSGRLAGIDLHGHYYDQRNGWLFWIKPPGTYCEHLVTLWVIAGLTANEAIDLLDWHNSDVPSRSIRDLESLMGAIYDLHGKQLVIQPVDL